VPIRESQRLPKAGAKERPVYSGLRWLSSSSVEITRARAVLDALRKPGVIDELGFLMLNAAFAERLYPAVTTIMTRARYLIFVPAIYRYLEQTRKAIVGKDGDRIARDLQFDLRNALGKNETSFIGKESGRNLIRLPSAVYWSALSALGIATRWISEANYQRQLSEGLFGRRVYKDDDDAVHDEETESLWTLLLKPSHIMPDGKFPDTTDFKLRKAEATFLESRYAALRPDGHESLVTRMVLFGRQRGASRFEGIDYPWQIPGCPPALETVLHHAERLSLLARGSTLQYYRMLIEKKRDDDPGVEDAFVEWWDQANATLATWDLQDFFSLMAKWEAGRGLKDREFVTSWIERSQASRTGRAALTDQTARLILRAREDRVRPGKQRLRSKEQLKSWKLPDGYSTGLYYMDYRHHVGQQIAMDIVAGLEGGAA
jgi:Family of unknown function (DUF6361)